MDQQLIFVSLFQKIIRRYLVVVAVSTSGFILGCNPRVTKVSTPKVADATIEQVNSASSPVSVYTLLSHGKYTSECQVDYSNQRSWITTFIVVKDSIKQSTTTYASTNCEHLDELVEYDIAPLELESTYETDIYLFKFRISKIELTPYTDENTYKLNNLQFAGFSDWKSNETKELYLQILTDREKSYFRIGETNYFHIKLENPDISIVTELNELNIPGKLIKYKYQSEL